MLKRISETRAQIGFNGEAYFLRLESIGDLCCQRRSPSLRRSEPCAHEHRTQLRQDWRALHAEKNKEVSVHSIRAGLFELVAKNACSPENAAKLS